MIGYWDGLPFGYTDQEAFEAEVAPEFPPWQAAQVFPEGQHNDTWEKGGDEQLDRKGRITFWCSPRGFNFGDIEAQECEPLCFSAAGSP